MKPMSVSKIFTVASLCLYSAVVFAQIGADNTSADTTSTDSSKKKDSGDAIDRANGKVQSCTYVANRVLKTSGSTEKPPILVMEQNLYKAPSYENESAQDAYETCYVKLTAPAFASEDDTQKIECRKIDENIDKLRDDLDTNCKTLPKVDPENATTHIGKCIEDSMICKDPSLGSNDSTGTNSTIDNCAEMNLDDIVKAGVGNVKIAANKYCDTQYPPQCGPRSVGNMHSTANDLSKDLQQDLENATKDKTDKETQVKDKTDLLDKANSDFKDLPAQFEKETAELKKSYDATVKAITDTPDPKIDLTKIEKDQLAVGEATNVLGDADSAAATAKDLYDLACIAKAKDEANQKFPKLSGQQNLGSASALVTRDSRRQKYYLQTLNLYKSQGTTCDDGKYAQAQRNAIRAADQLQAVQNKLNLDQQQLQQQFQIDIQKARTDKQTALQKALQDQSDQAGTLIKSQNSAYTKKQDEIKKLSAEKDALVKELDAIKAKIDAVPLKKNCIQSMHQCATRAGAANNKNADDAPDLEKAESIAKKIQSICAGAPACNSFLVGAGSSEQESSRDKAFQLANSNIKVPSSSEYYKSPTCLEIHALFQEVKGASSSARSPRKGTDSTATDPTTKTKTRAKK